MDIYIIRIFWERNIKIRARFFQSTEDIVSYRTLYILCIYPVILILVFYWSLISRLSLGLLSVGHTIQTTNIQQKPPPLMMGGGGSFKRLFNLF